MGNSWKFLKLYICWHEKWYPITWWHLMPASVKWALEGGTNALSSADGDKAHPNREFSFNRVTLVRWLGIRKFPENIENKTQRKTKSSYDMLVDFWMYPKKHIGSIIILMFTDAILASHPGIQETSIRQFCMDWWKNDKRHTKCSSNESPAWKGLLLA